MLLSKRSAAFAALLSYGLVPVLGDGPSYRDELLSLHRSLVEIPSTTDNEAAVGDWLIGYLEDKGLAVERQHLPSSNDSLPRFNVLAWPRDRPSDWSKVIITSHIDTVPPHIEYSRSGPEPPTAETVIAGRGTVDAKGSAAAQIIATLELLSAGLIGNEDIMMAYVVGEETGGAGMQHFSSVMAAKPRHPHAAIFGEPTEGKLACGHKGILGCQISTKGKAGHSGYPELGKSANELLMRALVKAIDTDLGSSERYGKSTLNVGLMSGGTAVNVIPEAAGATIAIRVALGPETSGHVSVKEKLDGVFASVDKEAFTVQCPVGSGAVFTSCDVDGFETATMNYSTDVPFLKGNHTRYLYGPGSILVAHTAAEAITVADLELAVEDYKRLILHAVGQKNCRRKSEL